MCQNPQIIVNGFVKAGITKALDDAMEQCDDVSSIVSENLFDATEQVPSDDGSILAYNTDYDQ